MKFDYYQRKQDMAQLVDQWVQSRSQPGELIPFRRLFKASVSKTGLGRAAILNYLREAYDLELDEQGNLRKISDASTTLQKEG